MNYNNIINICRDFLLNYDCAKETKLYIDNRISANAQEKFSLGYFPSFENLNMIINIVGEKKLIEMELLYENQSDHKEKHSFMEKHNIVMPFKDVYGNSIAIIGRVIKDIADVSKYKNTVFKKGNHLFGLYEAKHSIIKNNLVYVVEGQFDAISAVDKGLENTVALGTSAMTESQFALITRYTNNIVLLLDSDAAGRIGTEKIIKLFGMYSNIRELKLPLGFKDLDEYLSENSAGSLNLLL